MRKLIVSLLPTVLLTLLLSPSPALAVEEVLQAGSAGKVFTLGSGSALLSSGDGVSGAFEVVQLPAPDGAVYSALAVVGGTWAAAASYSDDEGARRLLIVRGDGDGVETLRPPRGQEGLLRQNPVLLTEGDRLVGLAWLEGDERGALEVRAARFDGRRFRGVHRVAPTGPGSQLALTGTVLADGSWLLAWTAFDGQDDEILWTQRVGGRWLPPARVAQDGGGGDNQVPDITPALASCGTGAVIAWSRYDGNDYRLHLARFRDGGWEDVTAIGAAGTLYPAFVSASDEAPRLVYRAATTGAWKALELDSAGAPRREVEAVPAPRQRPVVADGPDGEIVFRWDGKNPPLRATWRTITEDTIAEEEAP